MSKKIFVIHSADIIRVGISSLIPGLTDSEITAIKSVNELSSYLYLQADEIILFVDANEDKNKVSDYLAGLSPNIKSSIVAITEPGKTVSENEFYAASINVYSSLKQLTDVLAKLKEKNEQGYSSDVDTSLTDRECDVLKQIALGKANKDIADILNISVHTVISHRKNITEKLGIKSISGLTVYAIINKLIDTNSIDLESLI